MSSGKYTLFWFLRVYTCFWSFSVLLMNINSTGWTTAGAKSVQHWYHTGKKKHLRFHMQSILKLGHCSKVPKMLSLCYHLREQIFCISFSKKSQCTQEVLLVSEQICIFRARYCFAWQTLIYKISESCSIFKYTCNQSRSFLPSAFFLFCLAARQCLYY